jgi:transketolase
VILMATGSEVHWPRRGKLLERDGIRVRLVACRADASQQDEPYRDSVLRRRVARPCRRGGEPDRLARWVGDARRVAMEGFGASAPAKVLYEHFGSRGRRRGRAPAWSLERSGT